MFKIGEFSKLTQVSIRMLRYYDEMELLKPAAIDEMSGYRLYSAEQIPLLNRIVFLRDVGLSVSEIRTALTQWEHESLSSLLDEKYLEIEKAMKAEQLKLAKIKQAKKDIQKDKLSVHYNVIIKSVSNYQALTLRRTVPNYYSEGLLWKEMAVFIQEHDILVSDPSLTIYHDEDYREKDVDIQICMLVTKMGKDIGAFTYQEIEAIPFVASTMVYGDFKHIAEAYLTFAEWLQEQDQYEMMMQSRQIIHRGPWNESVPENYLIELQIPLKKI